MKLTYRYRSKNNKQIDKLTKISKDLYNQANYVVRQEFINNGKYLNYFEINKIMKTTTNKEGTINYRLLPAQTSQQILKQLDKNWVSFFRAIKDWKKNKSKYRGRPSLPKYIRKDKHLLIFPNQSIILKNNRLKNRKFGINIKLPQKDYKDFSNFLQVRIIPNHSLYDVEIVYNEPIKNHGLDSNKYLSIDLGINNLVTAISNDKNIKPLIIDGRPLKAINQLYNKKISKLKSIRTNGHNVQNKDEKKYFKQTKRIERITMQRNDKINDYLHKTSNIIVKYAVANGISTICVGELYGLKTSIKLSKCQNQQIVQIPLNNLKQKIKYKCELNGIQYKEVKEHYTSLCDALALETIQKHKRYQGKRIKRGLFQSSIGKLINADINGALNILRNVVGDGFIQNLIDSGILYNPLKIRNLDPSSLKMFIINN